VSRAGGERTTVAVVPIWVPPACLTAQSMSPATARARGKLAMPPRVRGDDSYVYVTFRQGFRVRSSEVTARACTSFELDARLAQVRI
jgi:hypothetical protein